MAPDKLKTTRFNISKKHESVREKGVYKSIFKGFGFTLDAKVNKAWPDLKVHISYECKDLEQAKLKMLENAVKDARVKASVMAAALGQELGDILYIDYSRTEIDINYRRERTYACEPGVCYNTLPSCDLTPDDIEAEDSVLTVWTLK